MIIAVHNNDVVLKVLDVKFKVLSNITLNQKITETLIVLADTFPEELLVWCHEDYIGHLNVKAFDVIFHHNRVLATFNPTKTVFLPKQIGYVERSYYLKINKKVTFPTWMMSGLMGGVHAQVLLNLKLELPKNKNFEYVLVSIAKRAVVEGLFCYSEPRLIKENLLIETKIIKGSTNDLFKFVKQHYKWVWVFFLFGSYLLYEKKFPIIAFVKSLFYKQLNDNFNLKVIPVISNKRIIDRKEIDVIIPTIGRKKYLYDVLNDFASQTIIPKNVIIVEQNSDETSKSELDYLTSEDWPFKIKHIFTHQTGVCNARNVALSQVKSEWTFLGDDDNRFDNTLIEDVFDRIKAYGVNVGTTVYLQPNEIQTYLKTAQTSIFGAGNSIVKSSLIKVVKFNTNFEFNYGEDNEFGMQLRNLGEDIVYFSDLKITHLKAPIGGYRTKVKQLWADDELQPKPSPTILLLNRTYFTSMQLLGYKLLLALRSYKTSGINNPVSYIKHYKKQWSKSLYWSTKLENKSNA